MKISILIPCRNEERSIRACVQSCLDQSRPADQVVVVNDGSTDNSGKILSTFGKRIKVVNTPVSKGNKSYAQEYGIKFVTGDIFISTDADTLLDKDFVKNIEKDFEDPEIEAVGGYVRSRKNNWLTACRAYDYIIGQNIHKLAQSKLDFMLVIPGAAGAFRTKTFKDLIRFDHDTVTEDLDFTYKLHKKNKKISYNKKAIVYTQDPSDLRSYVKQMQRWFGGGWQNLRKHLGHDLVEDPRITLELSLIYVEGVIFSTALFIIPLFSLVTAVKLMGLFFVISTIQMIYAYSKEKRSDIIFVPIYYSFLMYVNAWVFLEQFIKQGILKDSKVNNSWFSPERVQI